MGWSSESRETCLKIHRHSVAHTSASGGRLVASNRTMGSHMMEGTWAQTSIRKACIIDLVHFCMDCALRKRETS